jgi:hypothetical protein
MHTLIVSYVFFPRFLSLDAQFDYLGAFLLTLIFFLLLFRLLLLLLFEVRKTLRAGQSLS